MGMIISQARCWECSPPPGGKCSWQKAGFSPGCTVVNCRNIQKFVGTAARAGKVFEGPLLHPIRGEGGEVPRDNNSRVQQADVMVRWMVKTPLTGAVLSTAASLTGGAPNWTICSQARYTPRKGGVREGSETIIDWGKGASVPFS